MLNVRLEQLRLAARVRSRAAGEVLATQPTDGRPQRACYLMHVALECSLKARILYIAGTATLEQLRRVVPEEDFRPLFEGRSGHLLGTLAERVTLRRLLEAEQKVHLLQRRPWTAMCGADRPYSLRYGCEGLSRERAEDELATGAAIVDIIDRSLG